MVWSTSPDAAASVRRRLTSRSFCMDPATAMEDAAVVGLLGTGLDVPLRPRRKRPAPTMPMTPTIAIGTMGDVPDGAEGTTSGPGVAGRLVDGVTPFGGLVVSESMTLRSLVARALGSGGAGEAGATPPWFKRWSMARRYSSGSTAIVRPASAAARSVT